ncbi:fibroblast growth factor 2-like isoform X3 [Acinonyx jubatus]|uniref:Fibroblast growth factor 2-like isoform X3 n=1 Tax=Acinonyx jubatus TaxID=32536 RepID=A0ABM3QFH0_ACIJB|nr:fibroblast growth factor 2-like isoform X3 [Acinonyx jubatus]XP_053082669.1 fibroblast growth factor 2-like isoform X3 [Acinonyx jubatus]XP_053082670.1 fibroblast growth factor 2-like isoform X3 [Acinonyx jubatus]
MALFNERQYHDQGACGPVPRDAATSPAPAERNPSLCSPRTRKGVSPQGCVRPGRRVQGRGRAAQVSLGGAPLLAGRLGPRPRRTRRRTAGGRARAHPAQGGGLGERAGPGAAAGTPGRRARRGRGCAAARTTPTGRGAKPATPRRRGVGAWEAARELPGRGSPPGSGSRN